MSPKPIALNPDIKRLFDDGYEVEVPGNGYLAIHNVPYVTSQRTVAFGTVVTDLNENMGELLPPRDHQVWFNGDFPCHQTGSPIEAIRHTSEPQQLWDGFRVQHRFSNKPTSGAYPDYYSKMTGYIRIMVNEARAIDPDATPRTFRVIPPIEENTVFRYHDSASSRADILAVSSKLAKDKVAIVGLGGTGAYVLDLVAKTPSLEIHLFDGDIFLQHNAFRSPGAASEAALGLKLAKVTYYAEAYGAMRRGIVPHPAYLNDLNISELAGFDFVFICVDNGPARKLISDFLQGQGTPFIDVGMALELVPGEQSLIGTCRATLSTPLMREHFGKHVPMMDDRDDDLYRKNIQVADMNALNAALAVIQWKQLRGFYQNQFQAHHVTYSVNSQSLTRDEMPGGMAG